RPGRPYTSAFPYGTSAIDPKTSLRRPPLPRRKRNKSPCMLHLAQDLPQRARTVLLHEPEQAIPLGPERMGSLIPADSAACDAAIFLVRYPLAALRWRNRLIADGAYFCHSILPRYNPACGSQIGC